MLIRTCFTSLLKTTLENLQISKEDYSITQMPLKSVNLAQIEGSDLIFFAGGGLFGLSYLNFYDYMAEIIETAERNQIPVIFSSIGANNMDATEETEEKLHTLLQNSCIRAISVRENAALFQKYLGNRDLIIQQVCDPAVWCQQVYAKKIQKKTTADKKCIGINVVRGGLFEANGVSWKLKDEVEYLAELKEQLENAGWDYRFYTNGSLLDDNAMHFFAKEKEIPEEKLIQVHSSSDLVQAIAGFDATVSIRMHSAILSYSYQIPTLTLVWNDKITHFYKNIDHPDRAIQIKDWNAKSITERLIALLQNTAVSTDITGSSSTTSEIEYHMTLYHFLFEQLSKLLKTEKDIMPYKFEEITKSLSSHSPSVDEELTDARYKIQRGEGHYLARFYEIREKNQQIKALTKANDKLNQKVEQQKATIDTNKEKIEKQKQTIAEQKAALEKQKNHLQKVQEELNAIYHTLPGRAYRKLKKITTARKQFSASGESSSAAKTSPDEKQL